MQTSNRGKASAINGKASVKFEPARQRLEIKMNDQDDLNYHGDRSDDTSRCSEKLRPGGDAARHHHTTNQPPGTEPPWDGSGNKQPRPAVGWPAAGGQANLQPGEMRVGIPGRTDRPAAATGVHRSRQRWGKAAGRAQPHGNDLDPQGAPPRTPRPGTPPPPSTRSSTRR